MNHNEMSDFEFFMYTVIISVVIGGCSGIITTSCSKFGYPVIEWHQPKIEKNNDGTNGETK